jgi:hypothetical protein
MLKVFLGGEGNNDIGTRWQQPMGEQPGVVEALLLRVRPAGWRVAGAQSWKSIHKYRAGAARDLPSHGDVRNTLGLVLKAYEHDCDLLVFVRDADNDEHREHAIRSALASIPALGLAAESHYGYELAVVGGVAKPKLEGWVLCLLGIAGTDAMSPARADRELLAASIESKSIARYVEVARTAALPRGDCSLARWLAEAAAAFRRLIDGG